MQATSDDRHKTIDIIIVAIAFLLLVIAGVLLLDPRMLAARRQDTQLTALGSITRADSDVRRRGADEYAWNSARSLDPVYGGDSIYTGPDSNAVVQISAGSEIIVAPSSLVRITEETDRTVVELKAGSFSGTSTNTKKLVIKSGKSETIIKGNAKVQVTPSQNQGLQVSLTEGRAEIHTTHMAPVTLETDEAIVLEAPPPALSFTPKEITIPKEIAIPKKVSLNIKLNAPKNQQKFVIASQENIKFEWECSTPQESYKITISKDSTFSEILHEADVNQNHFEWNGPQLSKTFFWKVESLDNSKSITHSFTIQTLEAPLLLKPHNGQVLSTPVKWNEDTQKPDMSSKLKLPFLMQSGLEAESFRIQIASDPDFKKIVFENKDDESSFESEILGIGRFYWRAQILVGEKTGPWSKPSSFEIQKALFAKAPALLSPISNSKLDPLTKTTELKWKDHSEHDSYLIELSQNPEMSNAKILKTSDQEIEVQVKHGQTYYWRLRAIDADGRLSPYSDIQIFSVIKKPKIRAPKLKDLDIVVDSN